MDNNQIDRNEMINDPEAATRYALDGRQSQIWTAIPGIIQSVDMTAMTCAVQPAILGTQSFAGTNQTEFVNMPLIVDVPICFPNGGGFFMTFPVVAGDEALVVFSSRCMDSWWQLGGANNPPAEFRMHDLSDGFAIIGPKSQPSVISGISTTAAQLRNQSGTAYMGINASNLFQFQNSSQSLKGVVNGSLNLLTELNTALTAFTSATSSSTDPVLVAASTALATALGTLATAITTFSTTQVGGLLQ